ncbi:hypothetical protein RB195_004323 [Necator americanus]|uniref:Uncharacterized protein n=1 Tax=Necator americanus TaxID=51031 RepID=A0ABR1BJ67_NECAM
MLPPFTAAVRDGPTSIPTRPHRFEDNRVRNCTVPPCRFDSTIYAKKCRKHTEIKGNYRPQCTTTTQ